MPSTLLVALIAGALALVFAACNRHTRQPKVQPPSPASIYPKDLQKFAASDSGLPRAFGYKMRWFAVSSSNTEAVVDFLNRAKSPVVPANWQAGLEAAWEGYCFVTPAVGNWTLVVSIALDDVSTPGTRALLSDLSRVFGQAQFFGNHRGSGYGACGKFEHAQLVRGFSVADGEVFLDEGTQSPIERALLEEIYAREPDSEIRAWYEESHGARALADQDAVCAIAGSWSIDPRTLGGKEKTALGRVFKLD